MIFLKSILGGIGAVVLTWVIIVCVFAWRTNVAASQEGMTGLVAVEDGVTFSVCRWPQCC